MSEVEIFIERLMSVVQNHRGTLTYAEAVGAVELVKASLIEEAKLVIKRDHGDDDDDTNRG